MAMVKIVDPLGWNWERPVTAMIKLSSHGLTGQDRRDFIKTASHAFLGEIDRLRPGDGEVPVHLIALGAGEFWGCFFVGTPVQTYHGLRPIEQIQPGDLVLTHRNRFRPVARCFRRPYTGPQVSLTVTGLPVPVVATANQPFLVVRAKNFGVKRRCPCWNRRDGWTKQGAVRRAVENAAFVAARDIHAGDFVVVPVNPVDVTAEPLPDALAYTLGVYLAEGCVRYKYRKRVRSDRNGVVLALGTADSAVLAAVRGTAAYYGHALDEQPSRTSRRGMRATWYSRKLADLCARLFGGTATHKYLTPQLFAQSEAWKLTFLAGYFDGDGCVAAGRRLTRYNGVLRANTASLNLALDLQRLLASLHVMASVSKSFNRESNGCFGCGDLPIYEVSVGSAYAQPVLARCLRLRAAEMPARLPQSNSHTCGDYLLHRVRDAQSVENAPTEVFNLEVEDDNTYVTLVAGHNSNRNGDAFPVAACRKYHDTFCKYARFYRNHVNRDTAKSYGTVKASAYNEAMHRVELLAMLNGTKAAAERNGGLVADEELEKLGRGEDIPVSMSCKVPFDRCSSCGNRARTRADYCTESACVGPHGEKRGGCSRHLTKIGADGHILHVINDEPVWFDISHVFRPADRTAYGVKADWLAKAASHAYTPGAELAEALGVIAPPQVCAAGAALGGWSNSVQAQYKLAQALAMLEIQGPQLPADTYRAFTGSVCPDVTDAQIHELQSWHGEKRAGVLAALAEAGVILPLSAFARWTGKSAAVVAAGELLPGVFRRLAADPQLETKLAGNPYDCANKVANEAQRELAGGLMAAHSLFPSYVADRAMRSVIRGEPAPAAKDGFWRIKAAADNPAAVELVEAYGLYKLATLTRIAAFSADFHLTAGLVVGHNTVV